MTPLQLLAHRAQVVRATHGEVVSPCVSVCRMSPATDLCDGCFRTLAEIAGWSRMEDGDKRTVWGRIEQRAAEAG